MVFTDEPQIRTVGNLAMEDINANPSILPETTIDYNFTPVFFNPAVSIKIFIFCI